jgi:peptidoglycan/xylan/chitin deacetylase (PgdA/CDA1 family)
VTMDDLRWDTLPSETPRAALPLGTALVACALLTAAMAAFGPVVVTVDGRPRLFPPGATVADVAAAGVTDARRGDVIGVDGRVVAPARGGLPALSTLLGPARPGELLRDGWALTSARGRDEREPLVSVIASIAVPAVTSGEGPDVVVLTLGVPGTALLSVGELSRSVAASATLVEPEPYVVLRRPYPAGTKLIALTFDDGPWPGQTARVLDILKANGVKATFFVVGTWVRSFPGLVKREVAEGHVVGNHTNAHPPLRRLPAPAVAAQIAGGAAAISGATGIAPRWFRAPAGLVNGIIVGQAAAAGQRVVRWDVDPADWRKPAPDVIVGRVVKAARPGAVVLLHDGGGDRTSTIAALPEIIRALKVQGYRFVTLDQLYWGG